MTIYEALASEIVSRKFRFVTITGGGGKTSLLTGIAAALKALGKRVLLTTTTKLISPYLLDYGCDYIFDSPAVFLFKSPSPCAVFYALHDADGRKWRSPEQADLQRLLSVFDIIVCEGDGSRHLPVKIHSDRDPVVPPFCDCTISVFGMWALGEKTSEVAFGEDRDTIVDLPYIEEYFNSPEGLLKRTIEKSRYVVFSGADIHDCAADLKRLKMPCDVIIYSASLTGGYFEKL